MNRRDSLAQVLKPKHRNENKSCKTDVRLDYMVMERRTSIQNGFEEGY